MTISRGVSTFDQLAAVFGRLLAMLRVAQAAVAPFFDVIVRLWLAQLVWLPGMAGLAMWAHGIAMPTLGLMLTSSPSSMWWIGAHPMVAIIGAVCPPLLAVGFATRLAALPMLWLTVTSLLAHQAPIDDFIPIALLFAWYVILGAGPFSLDNLLARGIYNSALPFARPAGDALGEISQYGRPIVLLAIRLFIAASLIGGGTLITGSKLSDAVILFALLVGLGLLTRLMALPLAGVAAMTMMAAPTFGHTGWILIVTLVVILGPGILSIDGQLGRRINAQVMRQWAADRWAIAGRARVVIIGGGFGGIAAAKSLRHCDCNVTIIDQHNYHLFQPLLYQVATGSLSPADIALPIRGLFREQANVRVKFARVEALDVAAKTVSTDTEVSVGYDTLVIATGARHAYFGKDAWEPHAPGLKTIDDATGLRRRILLAFERAENEQDPVARVDLLTFAVIGGGPTGVELAGAIAELAHHGLAREFRVIEPAQARVILFQSGPRILPTFPESLSQAANISLRELHVEVRLDAKVEAVDEMGLVVAGTRIGCRTVFWAAGVAASPAASWLSVEGDRAGRVEVGADLSVPGQPDIFVIGDTALANAWDGKPMPGLAPAAKQSGKYVAGVIRARIEGRAAPAPFRYRHAGSLATIGRRSAVADFGWIKLSGAPAWWLWGGIHILFLAGGRNRLSVMVEWFWAYLTNGRGTRLITGFLRAIREKS
ncbi:MULTISPECIES: NAD(P)/FAD-dependent oxidoreductase [Acidiphilium]|uniref:NAD(P)/FAD-dependent oxidoreductase n=1 Tax=Acidiphilium TaxID=522 RepID=UPI00258CCD54|nr:MULTISPECIES: NAD(P)/FAD-dependent oxidoreductase [Acidiphilium]HQT86730.1 NAD(P)/FAD-dependent oxidoreductase [Acidiphilium rubrum]